MVLEVDFNSDEALYLQLRNQIIMGIATAQFREGIPCPVFVSWQNWWESICTPSTRLTLC